MSVHFRFNIKSLSVRKYKIQLKTQQLHKKEQQKQKRKEKKKWYK